MSDANSPLFGLSQRMPPANLQAEQALLGAILANNKALDKVGHILKPEHFADSLHGRLYEQCLKALAAGRTADPVTLLHWYKGQPEAQDRELGPYLAELLSAMVGINNTPTYAENIRDAWARRQIIESAELMVDMAFGDALSPFEIVEGIIPDLDNIVTAGGGDPDKSLAAASQAVLDAAWKAQADGAPPIYGTGIPGLDEILGSGFRPKDLIVLGGRPGHGKSSAALQIAMHQAVEYGFPVLFLSLEMTAEEQAARALSMKAGLSATRIASGRMSGAEADSVVRAQRELAEMNVIFDDRPRQSLDQVRMAIRRFRRKNGPPGLIVLDHLHLVRLKAATVKGNLGLTFATGEVANELKEIAKDEACPVLALAQLSRNKEGSDDKVPTLGDLKFSGDIEAAADTVFFTHREELHLHKARPTRKPGESDSEYQARDGAYQQRVQEAAGRAQLLSAKCRHGRTGSIDLRFDGETTTFLPSF
jgi:replicative DNA helicase